MIAAKTKTTYACSCGAKFPKQMGRCHLCGNFGTVTATEIAPKIYRIPKQSAKTIEANKANKGVKTDLDIWFDFQIKQELDNGRCLCQNCNAPIRHQLLSKDTWVKRGTIAHVLPKKPTKFPSVATHIHNFMILCLQCHADFDSSWDKAQLMQVFPLAKTKFKLFQSAIKEPLGKLPPELIN